MVAYILDTETTGLTGKDQVIEMAWIRLENLFDDKAKLTFKKRYRPTVQINYEAQKVHGISFTELLPEDSLVKLDIPDDIEYLIGHNISFDVRLLKQSNKTLTDKLNKVKLICTRRLSNVVFSQNKVKILNHKLDTILKEFYPTEWEKFISDKHSALEDCLKIVKLFEKFKTLGYLSEEDDFESIYKKQLTL